MLMVIGGCSGSTAGGLKFGRVLILVKAAYREIRLLPRPQAVIPIRVGGVPVSQAQVQEAARYVVTYLGLLMFVGLLVSMTGEAADDPVSALMLSVSSFGSIGPGYGACDPSGSFLPYAGSAKILAVVAMLLGRLDLPAADDRAALVLAAAQPPRARAQAPQQGIAERARRRPSRGARSWPGARPGCRPAA